mmetsp:Transcript_66606/g.124303  ORF Transcript_66606/g.124303 Transcript_66606/m.124303 type:complete len:569 (+) Transcript_66606:46-1752(+)
MPNEGYVDPYNKLSSDEDYENVLRWALQSKSTPAYGAEQLCWLLRQSHMRVHGAKRQAVGAWGGPLSLFDEQSEVSLGLRGAPASVTHAARHGQQLVAEAALLEDRTNLYEAQIVAAQRSGRGVLRGPLLKVLDWADDLLQRFLAHIPELQKARAVVDGLPRQDGFLGRTRTGGPQVSVQAVPLWRDLVNGNYVGAGKAWREQVGLQMMPVSSEIPVDIIEPERTFMYSVRLALSGVQKRFDVLGVSVMNYTMDLSQALYRAACCKEPEVLGRVLPKRTRASRSVTPWRAAPEILRHAAWRAWLKSAPIWHMTERIWRSCCPCAPLLHISPPQLTVGYWNIRGLGAPLRMMCEYSGISYGDQRYECKKKNNGRYSASEWERCDKLDLMERNDFITLPYVCNENNGDVVAQSAAVSLYLGRCLGLCGCTKRAQTANEQILFQVHAMWMEMYALVYPFKHNKDMDTFKRSLDAHLRTTILDFYRQLEAWLEFHGTEFVAGWTPCAADFHVWEVMDQHEGMARANGFLSPLDDFNLLQAYYRNFRKLPQLSDYFASQTAKLPANHKMAFYH